MNNLTKRSLFFGLFGLLLVANIATLIFFWLGRQKPPRRQDLPAREFLIRELGFDGVQSREFLALAEAHARRADSLRHEIRRSKEAMYGLLSRELSGDSLILAAAQSVAQLTEALDLHNMDHFRQVRAICSRDQQVRFDRILLEVVMMITGGGRGPGPGHPRPHGGGSEGRHGGPPPGMPDEGRLPPPPAR